MQPGARLGPYEIVAPLGAGGMGEVYRAKDTRLGRDVAVKVVHAGLTSDPDRLSRFEQEARAASQIDHPNILVVHDLGSHEGSPYIVSELLDGESLREKLGAPLPPKKAVDYASQVAHGLAAAHEKGIVHRDIKPENLFVTRDGRIKILDFGVAKLTQPDIRSISLTEASTAAPSTDAGVVLGTVAYMSPEQVLGKHLDVRSDLFSLGDVLYEMLSGKRPFQKDTAPETMTAILREEPPELSGTDKPVPPGLDRIVRHCLEKEPSNRFQSARDVAFALDSVSQATTAGTVPLRTKGRKRALAVTTLGIALLAATAGGFFEWGEKAGLRSAAEVTFRQMSFRPQTIFQAAFAPDGETIVYSAALEGNVPELFTIRPEYPEPRPLGLPRTHLLSISSRGELAVLIDARFSGFRQFTGTLARVPLGGTAPREILEKVREADWSPEGSELAIIRFAEGKYRLEFPIGKVLYETADCLTDLRVSPHGDRIALFDHPKPGNDRGSVILVDQAGKRRDLSGDYESVEGLAWTQTGDEVLYTAATAGSAKTLYGVDLSGHRRVALRSAGGLTMQGVSRTGRWLVTRDDWRLGLSVLAPGASAERDLSWLDLSTHPFLSRDGRMLLFNEESFSAGPNYRVCLRTSDGGPVVTLGEGWVYGFSPDGKWVLALIETPPQLVIYPTGAGETRRLPRGDLEAYHFASWFPDGKSVLVSGHEAGKASRCYMQDLSGGLPRPITPEATKNCSFSPDGQQILYSKPDGTYFIQRAGGGTAQPVPGLTSDDAVVRWRADGRALYVLQDDNLPFRIERLDLASGRRVLIRELAPADRAGVLIGAGADLTDDTKSYAYSYVRMPSQLFVVDGAR